MTHTYKNASLDPVPTSSTVIYTCPGGTQALITTLKLANIDNSNAVTANIEFYDSSASATKTIGNALPIPVGSVLNDDKSIVLEPGDQIKAFASDLNRLSIFLSILEIT